MPSEKCGHKKDFMLDQQEQTEVINMLLLLHLWGVPFKLAFHAHRLTGETSGSHGAGEQQA